MARDHTDTWLFFGDSITLGVNDNEVAGGYVSRLALLGSQEKLYDLPPATFYNLGVRRQKLAQIAARFEQEYTARLIPGMRSRFFFCTGTVDLMQGADPMQLAKELKKLLAKARDIAPSLFLCPFPVRDEALSKAIASFGLVAAATCQELNVPCVNLYQQLAEADFVATITDAVHPGPAGNALIAELLLATPAMRTFLTPAD